MSNERFLVHKIGREILELQKEMQTDYIKGMLRGLGMARVLALTAFREIKEREKTDPAFQRRETSLRLYGVLTLALYQMSRGDHKAARVRIEKEIQRLKLLPDNKTVHYRENPEPNSIR